MGTLIRNVRIFDGSQLSPKTQDILLENGRLSYDCDSSRVQQEVSGKDLVLLPGVVDSRVNFCDPGLEHREDMASGAEAARRGGVTEVLQVPFTEPQVETKALVQYIVRKSGPVQVHPMGGLSPDGKNLNELFDMYQAGAIAFIAGETSPRASLLKKALEYVLPFNGLVVVTPLDSSLSAHGQVHENRIHLETGLPSVPTLAEKIALQQNLDILRYTGGRLHVAGISSKDAVELIAQAKKEGLQVTAEVFLPNLLYNEMDQVDFDSNFKVRPYLRSEEDRAALRQAVLDGTIDVVSSDHTPQNIEEKECEFDIAAWGQANTQYLLPSLVEIFGADKIEKVLPAITTRPREIFGLQNVGFEEGASGPYTLMDLASTTDVAKEKHASRSHNTPLMGTTLNGEVLGTLLPEVGYISNS